MTSAGSCSTRASMHDCVNESGSKALTSASCPGAGGLRKLSPQRRPSDLQLPRTDAVWAEPRRRYERIAVRRRGANMRRAFCVTHRCLWDSCLGSRTADRLSLSLSDERSARIVGQCSAIFDSERSMSGGVCAANSVRDTLCGAQHSVLPPAGHSRAGVMVNWWMRSS